MRALFLALLLIPALPVTAQDSGLTCESIIANAENGGMDTQLAVSTYFHGKFMGKPCVEVDYDRAYALAQSGGIDFKPFLKALRERAASGNPKAIKALKGLDL